MTPLIRLRSGRPIARSIADYDASRPAIRGRTFRSFCYAPFLSMDFDAVGAVRLCNHSHSAVAQVSDDISVLDVWRGATYRAYREEMRQYLVDDANCQHCVRQCAAGPGSHVFATEQFDWAAEDDPNPAFPKRLIFRLNSTCNLACIMCDGLTSSRIRRERDQLPLLPSRYGEPFFRDMEIMLPHAEHIEFYGGEPFLVQEHLRIFEIVQRLGARCTIYVNTNAVSLHARARHFLEVLNFKTVAVSMDAVHPELHGEIRSGLRSDVFLRNIEYLLDLRARKGVDIMLNVTEHRKNWFELPAIFRFAEAHRLYLHINTCIHPHNVTLYTLPTAQLRYVLAFLEDQGGRLLEEHPNLANRPAYEFLLSLIRGELHARRRDWQPMMTNLNLATDGRLAAPRPGIAPWDRPEEVVGEADRMARMLDAPTTRRMLTEMLARVRGLGRHPGWVRTADVLEMRLRSLVAPNAVSAD